MQFTYPTDWSSRTDQERFNYISGKIAENPEEALFYAMLGEHYERANENLAYLSYEQAAFYTEKNGDSAEDIHFLEEKLKKLGASEKMTVHPASFIILSMNTLAFTKKCLETIRETCRKGSYELVVIDNNSEDGSREYLAGQEDVVFISNDYNSGFPAGCNQGARAAAKKNDIFLLNSDTEMPVNAFYTLRMGLYADPKNGSAGSCTNYSKWQQLIPEKFTTREEFMAYGRRTNVPKENACEFKNWLVGFAVLIRRDIWDKVGELDERFTPGCHEDTDYGYRIMQAGFRNVLCWNSFILHWGSKTFFGNKMAYGNIVENNLRKFTEKWGFTPTYYNSVRDDIAGLILHGKSDSFRLLDVGCGTGEMLGRLMHSYPNAKVYGVERESAIADMAATKAPVFKGDIEKDYLPYEEEFFDYIVLADVITDLYDAPAVLRKLHPYLKKGGFILSSVNNYLNAATVYDLLHGSLYYTADGRKRFNQIRFYTLDDIRRLYAENGYAVNFNVRMRTPHATTAAHPEFFDALTKIEGVVERRQFDECGYLMRVSKV